MACWGRGRRKEGACLAGAVPRARRSCVGCMGGGAGGGGGADFLTLDAKGATELYEHSEQQQQQ